MSARWSRETRVIPVSGKRACFTLSHVQIKTRQRHRHQVGARGGDESGLRQFKGLALDRPILRQIPERAPELRDGKLVDHVIPLVLENRGRGGRGLYDLVWLLLAEDSDVVGTCRCRVERDLRAVAGADAGDKPVGWLPRGARGIPLYQRVIVPAVNLEWRDVQVVRLILNRGDAQNVGDGERVLRRTRGSCD